MRILTLSNCHLRASDGSGQVILALAEGLRARGHEVHLFGPDDFEVFRWMRPRANSYRQTLGMSQFALRKLARERYDMVEIYGGEGWLTFECLRRGVRMRPWLVSHSNGLEPHAYQHLAASGEVRYPWWHMNQAPWMARGFRAADGLVVVSDFERSFALRERYQAPERVVTVRPGLHPQFTGLEFEPERSPVIGFCGSWLPRKGIELLRLALPSALRSFPTARALLVGVGVEFRVGDWFPADVAARIDAVPWVHERASLVQLYRRMSIALLPSFYESFGLAAAEAMACSAAVVVSQNGFGAELRDGQDALVLDDPRPETLIQAIVRLLAYEPLRRRIAASGHRRVQGLRWEASIAQLDATYRRWFDSKLDH
jgi:glycosyltransferase involved in cell wall biosynthesis